MFAKGGCLKALIFDLDGTLIQSEKLKARAYSLAAQQLQSLNAPDERAIEAYREIVGSARDIASRHVMERLGLEPLLRPLMVEAGAATPEALLTRMRVGIYDGLVADSAVVRENEWPHTVALLRTTREGPYSTALATMSMRTEVEHVLRSLRLLAHFDVIMTGDDVSAPKPDPEIYRRVAAGLGVDPHECLVLEDSVMGVRSAVAAGMNVVAVATPFTEASLERELPVASEWVVRDPAMLDEVVRRKIAEHDAVAHPSERMS